MAELEELERKVGDLEALVAQALEVARQHGKEHVDEGSDPVLLRQHQMPDTRVRLLIPKTPSFVDGSTATAATPTQTLAFVGLVELQAPILADRITYFPNGGGSDPAVVRLALYSEDGQQKLIDVTDAVANAAGATRSITFTSVQLSLGNYYILACLSSGATSPALIVFTTGTAFSAGASGEPDVEGHITISGGVAPATFDPTTLSAAHEDKTIVFRLDGVDPA